MTYPNEVMKILNVRGSIRAFKETPIPRDVLKDIIDAGCHAATGGNLQPYSIIQIESKEKKQALMDTGCMQNIVEKAPTNLLFCIDWNRTKRWAQLNKAPFVADQSYRHFWIAFQDTIMAAQNVCTAADSMGLGSVYIGTVESCFEDVCSMFQLPKGVFPVVIVSLGYPNQPLKVAPKLMSDVIVHIEVYTELSDEALNAAMDQKYGQGPDTPLSDKNTSTLWQTAKDVHGQAFADEAVAYAKELGHIHKAQRYFGLHYVANRMAQGNDAFLKVLEDQGFGWITGRNVPEM